MDPAAWSAMGLPDSFLAAACSQVRRLIKDLLSIFGGES